MDCEHIAPRCMPQLLGKRLGDTCTVHLWPCWHVRHSNTSPKNPNFPDLGALERLHLKGAIMFRHPATAWEGCGWRPEGLQC